MTPPKITLKFQSLIWDADETSPVVKVPVSQKQEAEQNKHQVCIAIPAEADRQVQRTNGITADENLAG